MTCAKTFTRYCCRSCVAGCVFVGPIGDACCRLANSSHHAWPSHAHHRPRARSAWCPQGRRFRRAERQPLSRVGARRAVPRQRCDLEFCCRREHHAATSGWQGKTDCRSHLERFPAEDGALGARRDRNHAAANRQRRLRPALFVLGNGRSGHVQCLGEFCRTRGYVSAIRLSVHGRCPMANPDSFRSSPLPGTCSPAQSHWCTPPMAPATT